ncbi:uncharacterized protein Dwil_GK15882 [Drosophila willistoni]|uniref:Uncharacterized protein n=1 Tax=Drosophila willistoni TaxID=7260 RepID=B4MRS8_DROWI|nr:uncharacterized protein LOC6640849 [Drosophila willistoni]EDW74817.1 uncharacterized protein Dwil_GK15882 [Drosophila willistoni]
MADPSFFYTPELISNKNRDVPIPLPDVKRIEYVDEFMSNPDNYSGDIKALTDRLVEKVNECEHSVNLLRNEILQKCAALSQLKKDLLELQCQLRLPDAKERFVDKDEKVVVKFLDEETSYEYDMDTALNNFSVKMSLLYAEIIVTQNDIDVVEHFKNIAMANCTNVIDWFESNQRSEEVNQSTSC